MSHGRSRNSCSTMKGSSDSAGQSESTSWQLIHSRSGLLDRRVCFEPSGNIGRSICIESAIEVLGDVADVRRREDVVQLPEGVIRRQRLHVEYIDRCASDPARLQRLDQGRLIEALQARRIAGAAVDVFDVEPLPPDHPFRKLDNVLATPHIGYVTEDLYRTFYADAAANIATWLDANSAVS